MNGRNYTPEEDFVIRRMFNAGKTDQEIADALTGRRFMRRCKTEAIRKARRRLGLKKVPTYERWVWAPFCHV